MFQGIYRGKKYHQDDTMIVLDRAWNHQVDAIVVTSGSVQETKAGLELCQIDKRLFTTIGHHPTRASEWHKDYLGEMEQLLEQHAGHKLVAIGELGLDYDRLEYSDKQSQLECFRAQMALVSRHRLPMFLHCRNAFSNLYSILLEHQGNFSTGVVHSFTGSLDEAHAFIGLGLHIGINGCSLKTEDNIKVVQQLPIESILLETDAPWCSMRPSHSSSKYYRLDIPTTPKERHQGLPVKGRNEPCFVKHVAGVVSRVRNVPLELLSDIVRGNTTAVFGDIF